MSLKARKPSCLDHLKKAHRAVLWYHEAIVAHLVSENGGGGSYQTLLRSLTCLPPQRDTPPSETIFNTFSQF
jgi:hypothetical protein